MPRTIPLELPENHAASKTDIDECSGIVLETVADYLYYNYKNRNESGCEDMAIKPELCLELLMAADFLNC